MKASTRSVVEDINPSTNMKSSCVDDELEENLGLLAAVASGEEAE
jgi:hypothetical protein